MTMEQNAVPEMAAPQVMQETPEEKLLRQSEVNEIAGRSRQEGYEKAKREAEAAMSNMAAGGISEEQVRQIVINETQRVREEAARNAYAQQLIGDFTNKMQAGTEKYEDFEQKVSALDLPKIPEIIQLANGVDNTADVMYEMASKPYKIGNLLNLARTAPHLAHQEMLRLSASIKENQKAMQAAQAPEPLSHMKPTSVPADNGSMSIKQLRSQSWMKR